MTIECLILGAGQEVGKSCVVVMMNGKRIMFDCGMHMGYLDHRRYPDFSKISNSNDFTKSLSCIIIIHFHLDHIGALPYFTQACGYNGPIYMTFPTKALAPLMLEDYRKVMVDGRGEEEQFSAEHIVECMKKGTRCRILYCLNYICLVIDEWQKVHVLYPFKLFLGLCIVLFAWSASMLKYKSIYLQMAALKIH